MPSGAMSASAIRFLRRGRIVTHSVPSPTLTVLDYLRLEEKSRGSKEGCNEGDCGACTVALGSLRHGRLVYEPANACILLMGHLHGRELVTVDDLADGDRLHPVQQAMVDHHGSQCGFCTPGFVMALFTLYQQGSRPSRSDINDHLAGNLCRCTGYRPIVEAGLAACTGQPLDRWAAGAAAAAEKLAAIAAEGDIFCGNEESFVAVPANPATLAHLAATHSDATLVAGATDVGLWITKQLRDIRKIIHVGGVADLHAIVETADHVSLGAAVTYAEAESHLAAIDPDVGEVLRRIGSRQVRTSGTIGGNIANGSPIGDTPPLLIALGTTIALRHGDRERLLPLEDFFIAYGKQDRKPGELLWRIDVPKLKPGDAFRAYKISKRFDQDISAVMAAFKISSARGRIISARIAYGGMAATPRRAVQAEAALVGAELANRASWQAAIDVLVMDFAPISDMRASATYRLEVAQALLRKALTEIAGGNSRQSRLTGARTAGSNGEAA